MNQLDIIRQKDTVIDQQVERERESCIKRDTDKFNYIIREVRGDIHSENSKREIGDKENERGISIYGMRVDFFEK